MKLKFLLLLLFPLSVFAQNRLTFETVYFRAEDHWVALPKKGADKTYTYGFIYLDEQAGFTLEYGGQFIITDDGKFVSDTSEKKFQSSVKLRLSQNTVDVEIIDDAHLAELGLPKVPDWLKFYKESDNKAQSLLNKGYFYNHVGGSDLAIPLLEEVHGMNPEIKGLGFELVFAYNATKDYKNAIQVLPYYVKREPNNILLYKEWVYALCNLGNMSEAENICFEAFKVAGDDAYRAEMAFNVAQTYYVKKDKDNFQKWAKITKKYAPNKSPLLEYLKMYEDKM